MEWLSGKTLVVELVETPAISVMLSAFRQAQRPIVEKLLRNLSLFFKKNMPYFYEKTIRMMVQSFRLLVFFLCLI